MQPQSAQLERGSVIGGYRIDEMISRGGMGVVYRATSLALSRIDAVKVLPPELTRDERFRERFKREMRVAAALNHPNIVRIHTAGEHEGLLYLAMDYVEGTDLREVLVRSGVLDPPHAVRLLSQIAAALDCAHKNGLVHRDVKPANVLITHIDGQEHAFLTDFGVAKRIEGTTGLTTEGFMVGTVDYMAPEQVTGGRIDARTDVYALGCVFFQMLTGKVPYERENSVATLFAHVHDPPPTIERPLADLYPTFGNVIAKAMAKQGEERYSSAGDMARDAAAALEGMRYTGPATMVATGDAKPAGDEAAVTAEAVTAVSTKTAAEHERATVVTERRAPGPMLIGLTALIVAAAVVLVIALSSGSSGPARTSPPIAGIRTQTLAGGITVRGPIPLTTGGTPAGVVVDSGGDAWVTDSTNNLVVLVRADGSELRVPVGESPQAVALDRSTGDVWVVNQRSADVTVVDGLGHVVDRSIKVGSDPTAISLGSRAGWVADTGDDTVTRIGETTFATTRIPVAAAPTALLVYYRKVWVAKRDLSMTVLAPADGSVTGTIPRLPGNGTPLAIAATVPDLWIVRESSGSPGGLTAVDGTPINQTPPYRYRTYPEASVAGVDPRAADMLGDGRADGTIWVISKADHRLSRIDTSNPGNPTVRGPTISVGDAPQSVAVFAPGSSSVGFVWVADPQTKSLWQIQYPR